MPDSPHTQHTLRTQHTLPVRILLNTSAGAMREAEAGDSYAEALHFDGNASMVGADMPIPQRLKALAEFCFELCNAPPELLAESLQPIALRYHRHYRSLSIGDTVIIGEVALTCKRVGWEAAPTPLNIG